MKVIQRRQGTIKRILYGKSRALGAFIRSLLSGASRKRRLY